ncbi:hypothetical protein [Orrella sp. 11846]|uniref:hypothetical protein n=1 Tax=Orrella sp. 11846 TaxID=3409913 RepID=UPI003B598748
MDSERLDRIERSLAEIKTTLEIVQNGLTALIDALAEEDEAPVSFDLDGNELPMEREPGQSLG